LIDGMAALDGWENFYVIVGSSAGALIGLQFVVVTLIADKPALRTAEAGAAFATPILLPFAANAMLGRSAYVAHSHARPALFVVGAATLLLFVGIHNAWDAVIYHLSVNKRGTTGG
jgi:uncharacterized membrane protein